MGELKCIFIVISVFYVVFLLNLVGIFHFHVITIHTSLQISSGVEGVDSAVMGAQERAEQDLAKLELTLDDLNAETADEDIDQARIQSIVKTFIHRS